MKVADTSSAQYALLRARELCLLGDYDQGISAFRAARQTLEMQLGADVEAQTFLRDLQGEYRTILEYRSTLQSLKLAANRDDRGKVKYSELAKENDWVDQELIEAIERDIVDHGESVTFDQIAGLEHTKQLLQETVMLPQIAPHCSRTDC
ncbi:hypothetical protein PInf_022393 [Phytophthora infestans]|nr:hypothetical protein PInf_022393 [Phytophthora infestans]